MKEPLTQSTGMRTGDVQLMAQVAQQEPKAQEVLVHRLVRRVRRAAGALLENSADADDASQLALLEVLGSARTYRGEASIEAWADRIAVRTTLRFARSRARRQAQLAIAPDPDALAPRDDAGAPLAEGLARPVQDYLRHLPENRRVAIVLRHVLGYSVDEVARLTGVSRNTVKDRLVHARREFRKLVRRDSLVGARADSVESTPLPATPRTA